MMIYFLSFLAGALTALSPCILPVLPIMAGSSMSERKSGPLYIGTGLTFALVTMGLLFSTVTSFLGMSEEQVRELAAWLMIAFGLTLILPRLRAWMGSKFQGIGSQALEVGAALRTNTRVGQFGIGLLLGAAWSPCVGPTLGVAIGMAGAAGGQLESALMMTLFGLGLSAPMLAIAYGLRHYIQSKRSVLMKWNQIGMQLMGVTIAFVGLLMVTGAASAIERILTANLPIWFLSLSSMI